MRQRLDDRGVDREHRVEQVGEADALRLGDEAEERAVAVETPGPALLDHVEAGFVVAVEQLVGDLPARGLVGQLQGLRAEPLDADDGDRASWQHASDYVVWLKSSRMAIQNSTINRHAPRSF